MTLGWVGGFLWCFCCVGPFSGLISCRGGLWVVLVGGVYCCF